MIVYNIQIFGYEDNFNHCVAAIGDKGSTLCGDDIAGDYDRIITKTNGKITCPKCIQIIDFCKSIKKKDIQTMDKEDN